MRKAYQYPERQGKVYFIQVESGPVKIGFTRKRPEGRLKELQTGNHQSLTLVLVIPGTQDDELKLHQEFARLEIRSEWYRPEQELLDRIRLLTTQLSAPTCPLASSAPSLSMPLASPDPPNVAPTPSSSASPTNIVSVS